MGKGSQMMKQGEKGVGELIENRLQSFPICYIEVETDCIMLMVWNRFLQQMMPINAITTIIITSFNFEKVTFSPVDRLFY